MYARTIVFLAFLLLPGYRLEAQQTDSARAPRADSLRGKIEERFASRVQRELGLTNEQTAKLRASSEKFGARRRELRSRELALKEALMTQLRPGVAAKQDSVTKLTDALIDLKIASAQAARDEMKDLAGYLNPVQRARLLLMRERFYHRVKEFHGHREMHGRRMRDRSWM